MMRLMLSCSVDQTDMRTLLELYLIPCVSTSVLRNYARVKSGLELGVLRKDFNKPHMVAS